MASEVADSKCPDSKKKTNHPSSLSICRKKSLVMTELRVFIEQGASLITYGNLGSVQVWHQLAMGLHASGFLGWTLFPCL